MNKILHVLCESQHRPEHSISTDFFLQKFIMRRGEQNA